MERDNNGCVRRAFGDVEVEAIFAVRVIDIGNVVDVLDDGHLMRLRFDGQ